MRGFVELMTKGDAADAAAALCCELEDVIRIARMAVQAAAGADSPSRPEAFYGSLLSVMRLVECMVERVSDGVSDLGREARRGVWREPTAEGIAMPVASARIAGDSPVIAAFREWKVAHDFVEGPATRGWSDEQLAPHLARYNDLVNRMVHLPARDALDVCAKLTAFTHDGRYFADDDGLLSDFILRDARAVVMERGA